MQLNLGSLQMVGMDAVDVATTLESQSTGELSTLQEEYRKFFEGQVKESGFDVTPFEGDEEQIKEFFNNVKIRWAARKAELAEKGVIPADKV
ncbi:hypothetical protein BN7874_117 [Phage NCTB]|nr:hypothetical protein BN7874_117 [Phage NCTB]